MNSRRVICISLSGAKTLDEAIFTCATGSTHNQSGTHEIHCGAGDGERRRDAILTMIERLRRNLLLVARPRQSNMLDDFRQIAAHCRDIDSTIRPIPLLDAPWNLLRAPAFAARPTLVFAPQRLLFFHPLRGVVRSGRLLPKSEEYRRLESAGVPVPEWRLLTRAHSPDVTDLGRHVVTKPDYGGRGADVRIRRASRVRWRRSNTPVRFAAAAGVIAQKFIYTGPWPVSYRVSTLFGRTLFSWRVEASHERRAIDPNHFDGMFITSSHRGCSFQLNYDPEIIALGERAHSAFPAIPFLGIDIVREEPSGRLFVLEVNSAGDVWHFSSTMGVSIQRWAGFDLSSQYGGLRRAAEILIEETHQQAR